MPQIRPIPAGNTQSDAMGRIGGLLKAEEPAVIPEEETAAEPAPEPEREAPTEPEADEEAQASEPEEADTEEVEAAAEDTEDEGEPDIPAIAAPLGWSDAEKAEFAKLSPEAQHIVAERESEREAHLTRKSQEAAEQLRQSQDAQNQIQAERQHYEQVLEPMLDQLSQRLQSDEARLAPMLDPNSEHYNPEGYLRERARIDAEKGEVERARQEQQKLEQQRQQMEYRTYTEDVRRNEEMLVQAIPEWGRDLSKGKNEIQAIRDYVIAQGVDANLANQEYRAPMILMARKAMEYDKLMSKKPELQKKLKAAPKVQKPGTVKKADPKTESRDAARRQLRRARGTRNEAAAFIKALKTQ